MHALHGRWRVAAGSLALDVGVPVIAGVAGWQSCSGNWKGICAALYSTLGWLIGAGIDVSVLARVDVPAASSDMPRRHRPRGIVMPLRFGIRF